MPTARPRSAALRTQRGSVTVWLATATFVMVVLVGLTVDLTGQVHAQQRARDVAAQAARVGGQEINAPSAVRGLGVHADTAAARTAAQAYLNTARVTGTATIQGGTTLVVTTSDTYQPKFLSIIGLGGMRVTGSAEARIVRVVGGAER